MDLFDDIFLGLRISQVASEIHDQSDRVDSVSRHNDALEQEIARLRLVVAALSEIVQDQLHVPASLIVEKMREIDSRDGKPDGRITRFPAACQGCQRPLPNGASTCLYCGVGHTVASDSGQ